MAKFYKIQTRRKSFFNFNISFLLIIINAICFILFSALIYFNNDFINYIALKPLNIINKFSLWTLITSMFMHGNFTHLFVNMVSLFFIGNFIEKLIGKKRFFWLYMLSGIFAGIVFVMLAYFFGNTDLGMKIFGSPDVFAVGASGAIFALGGLLVVLTPRLRVYAFFIIPMRIWVAMVFFLAIMWIASVSAGLPFGNTAHLGGLIAGIAYGLFLKNKYPKKTRMLSNHFS
jgi:membrane associated rhomboid family serine protease